MQWIKYLDLFCAAILILMFYKKIINIVFKKTSKCNIKKMLITIIISAFGLMIINYYIKNIFKVALTLPFTAIFLKNCFNESNKKSILYAAIATFYIFAGEFILSFLYSTISFDFTFVVNNYFGGTFATLLSIMFTFPLLYFKKINKLVFDIVKKITQKEFLISISIILIELFMGAITFRMTMKSQDTLSIIMNIIIMTVVLTIVYFLYLEAKKSQKISDNYNILLSYLDKYEQELVEKRKIIHDYKNQIIIINGYINEKKKLKEYLNEIIKEQKEYVDNNLLKSIDKLPKGLKGIIYYKLSTVINSIKIDIKTTGNLKIYDNLKPCNNKDTLKIIGILLDNAIEASSIEKDPYMYINIKIIQQNIKIEIANKCSSEVKINKIRDNGYSTKGMGRGYGLSLIEEIIIKNPKIKMTYGYENKMFYAIFEETI